MYEETDWEDTSAMRIPLCDLDFPALDEQSRLISSPLPFP
jgi:hypothetical protein